jgi:hypothetical protein
MDIFHGNPMRGLFLGRNPSRQGQGIFKRDNHSGNFPAGPIDRLCVAPVRNAG